ncbi:GNAT family N-acetyltransferase [Kineococcus glutinatus]|uniref:BioF2-like acetyltransferase domain-containing protein n=1 Tax=Kineococcus glutinatus TaxID=1070872 RepID=A0ABP8VBE4_9ACTN
MTVLVPTGSSAQWDALVDGAEGATAFHRHGWLQLQARLHGWRFVPLLVRDGGRDVGVLPLLLVRRGPLWVEAPVPFPYVGPLVPPALLPAVLAALTRWARRRAVAVTRLDLGPGAGGAAAVLREAGWVCEEATTFVADVSHGDVAEVRRRASKSMRRSARRAEQLGVVVADATEEQVRRSLPALLAESYGARGVPSPYPAGVGDVLWAACGGREDVLLRSATLDGEVVGLEVALVHGDTLYDWAGGTFRAHRDCGGGALLQLDVLERAAERGLRRVDLVGAVDEGVAHFKRSTGAREESFVMATRVHSRLWATARRGSRVLASVAGRGLREPAAAL